MPPPADARTRGVGMRGRWLRWGVVLGLLVLALGAHQVRRGFIRAFFLDGPGGAPVALTSARPSGEVDRVARLRVVLLDGLGADHAVTLPKLGRWCSDGLDLRVDTGFPTVSLPVQHVLWTGLTQSQSGILYRIAPLTEPPAGSLPAGVPGSIAVAEAYPEIVHSFGFARALPVDLEDASAEETWRSEGFREAAIAAVRSNAPLAFVHVLRIDQAGHAHGAASPAYAEAATWADELLDALVRADAEHGSGARWVVLSDHGHRRGGGHGGAEASIRIVRACVFGQVPPIDPSGATLHLVDLSRFLADSLALELHPDGVGRPLAAALEHPDPGATLPRPGLLRWAVAALWLLAGMAATAWAARGRLSRLPWWIGVAYLSVVALHGAPTLSHPMIYPPWGRDMIVGALPGLLALAWSDLRGYAGETLSRRVMGHLALVLAISASALTLCGELGRLVELTSGPPLVPIWTAQSSVLLTLTLVHAVGTAALLLVRRG